MMLKKWFQGTFCHVCLLVMTAGLVQAAPLDDLARDFNPIEGYLILVKQDFCLVDLDASDGLMAGDLLRVQKNQDKVIHPVSGEVIEVREVDAPVVQITMVDNGFSRAKLITPEREIMSGQAVVRYAGLTADLEIVTRAGRSVYDQLVANLPHLLWQGYRSTTEEGKQASEVDLKFRLNDGKLTVVAPDGQILHSYAWPVAENRPARPTGNIGAGALAASSNASSQSHGNPGRGEPKYLGTIDGEIVMSAFLQYDGRDMVAVTDGRKVTIFALNEELRPLVEMALPISEKGLTLAWWQPSLAGAPYLVIGTAVQREIPNSVSVDTAVSSVVYEFGVTSLTKKAEIRGGFLNSFDLDSDGHPEALLGQEFDATANREALSRYEWQDGQLQGADPGLELPGTFKVHGSLFVDVNGDGRMEVAQIENGCLAIYQGQKELYRSPRKFGGSIARLTYDLTSGTADPMVETRFFQVDPVASDVDQDGLQEIVAAGGDIPTVRAPGVGPGVSRTWLSVIKKDGSRFYKKDLSPEFDNPIQGVGALEDRLVFLVTKPNSLFGQGGQAEVFMVSLE